MSGAKWGKVGWTDVFMGEHRHALDDKNRLFIPARFRQDLGPRFIVTKGLDRCIFVYAPTSWLQIETRLKELPFTRSDARAFSRFFLAGAEEVEPDKQGRILLPSSLREHAGLSKESVIIGVGERVEIWAQDGWENYMETTNSSAEELAEKLSELGGI